MADDRTETGAEFQAEILRGIPEELPEMPPDEPGVNHAPDRPQVLAAGEREQAVKNALRYFPDDPEQPGPGGRTAPARVDHLRRQWHRLPELGAVPPDHEVLGGDER
jgi:hypothetical protein